MQNITNLVWMDLEMTGLDPDKHEILQVAVLVTDTDLNILDPLGYVEYVSVSEVAFSKMDMEDKGIQQLVKNGVVEGAKNSKKDIDQVDNDIYQYLKKFVGHRESPLCGNTVIKDRMFTDRYMPLVSKHLHYRNIDVSTVKQLVNIWLPEKKMRRKSLEHEALSDIQESIEELRYYREFLFDKA